MGRYSEAEASEGALEWRGKKNRAVTSSARSASFHHAHEACMNMDVGCTSTHEDMRH